MIEMLQYGFMQRAFITGILLAVIAPLIGITIVLKRMSMIGDALSHASLAGVRSKFFDIYQKILYNKKKACITE